MIPQSAIVAAVHSVGVRPGDVVLCHSSYKSFGDEIEGGPDGVARALIAAVGESGSVFVPTFNFAQLPYKADETPSLTGVITDRFWRLPGVVRSLHPTHPLAGAGPLAVSILEGHERTHPFGEGSPIWKLWTRHNAWVLQLGVEHSSNSTVHVAEEENHLPYVPRIRTQKVWRDGAWETVTLRRPGDSNGFIKVGPVLEAMNAIRQTYVGGCRIRLMRQDDVMRAVESMVSKDRGALLCDDPTCERCNEARRMIAGAGGGV